RLTHSLPVDYLHSLIHLYQPLVGMEAISLYQILLLEVEVQKDDHIQTHHTLMNYLNMPLDELYKARIKLEGIGLLKTYKQEQEEKVSFTYMLMEPFSPQAFFADTMLSELLYRHIGKSKFHFLKNHYTKTTRQDIGEDITVSFGDVFKTYHSDGTYEPSKRPEASTGVPIGKIDFTPLEQALQRKMIPVNKVLTEENRRMIAQLMELYDLETYEMEKALFWALNEENLIDIEQLKVACHDLFKGKHNVADIKLLPKNEEPKRAKDQKLVQTNASQEERLIERLETISPKELLEDLSGGYNASEQDMKAISDIMLKQGLSQPVMNVLIYYVLLQSDMKLSKPYLEKIASHWSRVKLTSAKEAMEFARKQIQPKTKPHRQYRSNKQAEVIPDWFKEQQQKKQTPKKERPTKQDELQQEELIALLKRHTSEN